MQMFKHLEKKLLNCSYRKNPNQHKLCMFHLSQPKPMTCVYFLRQINKKKILEFTVTVF